VATTDTKRKTNLVLDIADERLELFLKLAANARTRHDRREIDRENSLVVQGLLEIKVRGKRSIENEHTSGTSFATILLARPSRIAVFPTPGGPMSYSTL
jgi:hypothetical protein